MLVALGIGAAYQHLRWLGLLPIAVLLIYYVATSLARTSGGRYLLPVDWIMVCYFGLGLAEVLRLGQWLTNQDGGVPSSIKPTQQVQENPLLWPRAVVIIFSLGIIGGLVPLAGVIYPLRYSQKKPSTLANQINPYFQNLCLTAAEVNTFLEQPGAVIMNGRALYPRFYRRGAGEPVSYRPFYAVNYPRTVFILIGPNGLIYAILPGNAPKSLKNANDAVVLGCRSHEGGYTLVSVLAAVFPDQQVSYARSPAAPLTCPLRNPVCDNNGNCW